MIKQLIKAQQWEEAESRCQQALQQYKSNGKGKGANHAFHHKMDTLKGRLVDIYEASGRSNDAMVVFADRFFTTPSSHEYFNLLNASLRVSEAIRTSIRWFAPSLSAKRVVFHRRFQKDGKWGA